MELPVNTIIHGLCLDVLRKLPDESIDAIVTDPPYGLGTREPTVEELIAYLRGEAELDLGGEFMNKDWLIPSVDVWRECFRVLKPGGHLLSFAGTKTQDVISMGLRAAGFEKRDEIDIEFGPPVLRWLRAQGMPKSTDIGKAIDAKAGKKRAKGQPETPEAVEWDGWGTGLKPYWEPVLMFRKPVAESTVAEQVLKTGTGAINIEASRVKHASKEDFEKHKAGVDAIKAKGGSMAKSWKNSSDLSGANEVTTSGRFPPNVIFVHSDACKKTGTMKVPAHVINRFDDGAKPFGDGAGHEYTTVPMGDENGEEEIETWDCHPTCPAKILNDQSGHTVSRPDTRQGDNLDTREQGWRFKRQPSKISDSGGASRFFMNFEPDALFQYVPKPSQGEKNTGLAEGDENEHVTVKPVKLMRYLVRLVTPKNGIVLDPYCGSGTTCVAAVEEDFRFIGIEKEKDSAETADARTLHAIRVTREWKSQREVTALAHTIPDDDEPITPV